MFALEALYLTFLVREDQDPDVGVTGETPSVIHLSLWPEALER